MQHFLDDHTLANGVTLPPLETKTHSAEEGDMEEEEALVSQKINTCDSPSKTDQMIIEETQNLNTFQSDVNHSDEPSVSENKKDLHSIQSTDVPTESNQPPLSTNPLEESVQTQINDNFPIENEEQVPFDQTSSSPNRPNDEESEKLLENSLQEKNSENQETNLSIGREGKKNNIKNSLKKGSVEIHESPNPKKKYNRKATHSKYNELVSFIDCLSKFNWSKNYVSGQKISAARYYTPNVYWFLINAEYFPRNTFAHKNNKESIHNRLYRLKGFTPDVPQRLTRVDLKSDAIQTKPIETSEHMQLSSFSKAIKHSTEAIRASNLAASRNITHVHKPNYTNEDDEWMIEMRRFIYENYTTLQQENNDQIPENFDVLSKIDLQDLILLYEKDLYGIASHNEKEIDAIETNISDFIEQEEPLRKLNHDLQDSLVDFKMKFPEEEAFIAYLEKKQNEAKDNPKPTEPMPNESHGSKSGKKGSGSMGRKTNTKVKLEDAICQICNDADYSDDDLIVFCAKCNIGVHQQCYGIPVLPEGDWICDVCLTFQEKGKLLRCPFCDKRGGAMKPTCTRVDTDLFEFANPDFDTFLRSYCQTESVKAFPKIKPPNLYINKTKNTKSGAATHQDEDDEEEEQDLYYDFELLDDHFTEEELKDEPKPPYIWAHISCVLFIPELYFGDDIYASNILGLENINKDRFKYECSICEKRKNGAIVNCERNSCKKAFHPECARRAQTFLEIRENENNQFIYHIYCEKHTPLKLKRTIESLENKMKDEIQKFFNAIDKQYAAYLQESKPSRPELHASNTTLTKEQIIQEENLKKKKLLSMREEGNYFLKLIDKYINQHKNQPLSITLQGAPSDDGVEKFEIFDITIPKTTHRAKTKLSFDDEIWRNMPYKNLTPEQKYQKYSKLYAEMKKKQKVKLLKLKSTQKATSGGRAQENRNQSGRRLRDREPEKPQTQIIQLPQKKTRKGKVDNEEKSDIIYCLCRKTYDGKLMIDCEQCENWYHPKCVGLPKGTDWKKLKYTCKSCIEKNIANGIPDKSVLNKRSLDLENANNNKKSLPSKKLKKQ